MVTIGAAPVVHDFPRMREIGELGESIVSPAKTTDASKLHVPIAWVVGIVVAVGGFGISQALSMAALRSDVRDILTRMQYEAQMSAKDQELSEARFKALEAKIDAASLRNFNMMQASELAKKGRD